MSKLNATKPCHLLFILVSSLLSLLILGSSAAYNHEDEPTFHECLQVLGSYLLENRVSTGYAHTNINEISIGFSQQYPECKDLLNIKNSGRQGQKGGFAEHVNKALNESKSIKNKPHYHTSFLGWMLKKLERSLYLYDDQNPKNSANNSSLINCFIEGKSKECGYSALTGTILYGLSVASLGYTFSQIYNPEFYPSSQFIIFACASVLLNGAWWSNKHLKTAMLGLVGYRAMLLNSGDYYHLQSSGKIQDLLFSSYIANRLVAHGVALHEANYWSYFAYLHTKQFIVSLSMVIASLAYYTYRISTPEERWVFLGESPVSYAITAVAALGSAFCSTLLQQHTEGFKDQLSERGHLLALYGGAFFLSLTRVGVYQRNVMPMFTVLSAFLLRSFHGLTYPVMEPGEDFNPVPAFIIGALFQLIYLF